MRKTIMGIACVMAVCFVAGCGGSGAGGSSAAASSSSKASAAASSAAVSSAVSSAASEASSQSSGGMNVGMPNPWVDFGTTKEAAKAAGFDMTVPEKFDGNPITLVQAVKNDMMQVFYSDKSPSIEGSKRTIIRKGVKNGDISGDYNEYKKTDTVKVGDREVTLKGDGNKVFNITWTDDKYSYAVMSDVGISTSEAQTLVSLVE